MASLNISVPYYFAGLAYQNEGEKEKEVFTKIANSNSIGLQISLVKPFAKNKLIELSK